MPDRELQLTQQKLDVGALIVLFQLNLEELGGPIIRWTSSVDTSFDPPRAIRFAGEEYVPLPVEATGFEWKGSGPLPTPHLRFANVEGLGTALLRDYEDLLGAKVTRLRTFSTFLDGGDDPDPEAVFPPDQYRVERKAAQTRVFIDLELSSVLDQQGRILPGRLALRDNCTHIYRRWVAVPSESNGGHFDYEGVTCPYTGRGSTRPGPYWTVPGVRTEDPARDLCGKRLDDCRLRFGRRAQHSASGGLPTRAFPGLQRT